MDERWSVPGAGVEPRGADATSVGRHEPWTINPSAGHTIRRAVDRARSGRPRTRLRGARPALPPAAAALLPPAADDRGSRRGRPPAGPVAGLDGARAGGAGARTEGLAVSDRAQHRPERDARDASEARCRRLPRRRVRAQSARGLQRTGPRGGAGHARDPRRDGRAAADATRGDGPDGRRRTLPRGGRERPRDHRRRGARSALPRPGDAADGHHRAHPAALAGLACRWRRPGHRRLRTVRRTGRRRRHRRAGGTARERWRRGGHSRHPDHDEHRRAAHPLDSPPWRARDGLRRGRLARQDTERHGCRRGRRLPGRSGAPGQHRYLCGFAPAQIGGARGTGRARRPSRAGAPPPTGRRGHRAAEDRAPGRRGRAHRGLVADRSRHGERHAVGPVSGLIALAAGRTGAATGSVGLATAPCRRRFGRLGVGRRLRLHGQLRLLRRLRVFRRLRLLQRIGVHRLGELRRRSRRSGRRRRRSDERRQRLSIGRCGAPRRQGLPQQTPSSRPATGHRWPGRRRRRRWRPSRGPGWSA